MTLIADQGTGEVLCDCHGEPSYWDKDDRYRAGGHWRCAVKIREKRRRRYREDGNFKARVRQASLGRYHDRRKLLAEIKL